MKALRMFGLAALAAVAAMAFVGAASAQAATIEPENEAFSALSTNSKLTYGSTSLECPESNTSGNTTELDDKATVESLSFGPIANCKATAGKIESIKIDGLPWTLLATEATGSGNGKGKIIMGGPALVLTQGLFANCLITVPAQEVDATWDFTEQLLLVNDTSMTEEAKEDGGSCLLSAKITNGSFVATYKVKSTNKIGIF